MPIYEYRRPDGSTFEVLQSFTDEPLEHDPQTGVPVQRVLHAPAVHFKGKGFYNTDYGTRKRQRETSASTEGSSAEGVSTDAGSADGAAANGSSSQNGSADGGGQSAGPESGSSSAEKKEPAKAKRENAAASAG